MKPHLTPMHEVIAGHGVPATGAAFVDSLREQDQCKHHPRQWRLVPSVHAQPSGTGDSSEETSTGDGPGGVERAVSSLYDSDTRIERRGNNDYEKEKK